MTASWDFDYRPARRHMSDDGGPRRDLVIATEHDVDPARILELLAAVEASFEATPLVSSHPLYWTRLRSSAAVDRADIVARLEQGGVRVRYVTCARHSSQALALPLDFTHSCPRRARDWKTRTGRARGPDIVGGRWFLGPAGVDAREEAGCGTGAGTRLAVIDDDSAGVEHLCLDAEIKIFLSSPPQANAHAATLVGWAVGTSTVPGVAPSASPRLYVIPKPGHDAVSLPLAIVRAVDDGADVVVCATYIDEIAGPLLDDALELAANVGRAGRGTSILFPTSREISSPAGSTHASLSLSLGAPACHPLAFCIGPSSKQGAWFLWPERSGKLRPFANRGPAVRWLAPGDDMADPLAGMGSDRLAHAESSGASAIAAGVVLLVLEQNAQLTRTEIDQLLTATAVAVPGIDTDASLVDASDGLPYGRDADGHDAKTGYGRLSASRACLSANDPVAMTLVRIGEDESAATFATLRRTDTELARAYSPELARWAVRALLADTSLAHALTALVRHARLVSQAPARAQAHPTGSVLRQLGLLVRMAAASSRAPIASELVAKELTTLARALLERTARAEDTTDCETAVWRLATTLWPSSPKSGAEQAAE